MTWVKQRIVGLLLVQLVISSTKEPENVLYMIVSPAVFHPGNTAKVSVNLFGNRTCEVAVKIYFGSHVSSKATGIAKSGEQRELQLKVPVYQNEPLQMQLEGRICGTSTKREWVQYSNPDKFIIQTDKPIYKPNQKIRMRIVYLNAELKPATNQISTVSVEEPSGIKIMQWNNVKLNDGIANLELQLSDELVLGNWKIKAILDGGKIATKEIEIGEYVLPKFEVVIIPPPYAAEDQMETAATICAKYTYGGPVKGKLDVVLCSEHGKKPQSKPIKCHKIATNIAGCTEITITMSDLIDPDFVPPPPTSQANLGIVQGINPGYPGSMKHEISELYLVIKASVTESSTGTKLDATPTTIEINERSVELRLIRDQLDFKPGLPFKFRLNLLHPDGSLVTGPKEVQIRISYDGGLNDIYNKNIIVSTGVVVDVVKNNVPYNDRTRLEFEAILVNIDTGEPSDSMKMVNYSDPWYSPSNSFLQISRKHDAPAKVNSEESLLIAYTVRNDTGRDVNFYYNVICKGNIEKTGIVARHHDYIEDDLPHPPSGDESTELSKPIVEEFELNFPVNQQMVPRCRVLVYYVRHDKEIVADSIVYDIEEAQENEVSLSFANDQTRPGKKTKLILKGKPGSRIVFSAVDESVHLLRKEREKSFREEVMDILHRLEPQRFQDARDHTKAFNDAGLILISNLETGTTQQASNMSPPIIGVSRTETSAAKKEAIKVRRNFPKTWLWEEEKLESGNKTIEVVVPDTIRTWVVNGFAMSSVAGVSVVKPTSIKAFQPFFVRMTLPYSVIRGEEIPITVTVFNYLRKCLPVKLALNRKSSDYKVTSYNIRQVHVCGDAGHSVKFTIIPTNLGHIPLTVTARTFLRLHPAASDAAADAITRKLLVEPQGIKQEYTKGMFFCPKGGDYSKTVDLSLPEYIISGSVFQRVSIVGDIMGPALSNLDSLLAMPSGCGELNMANFATNIYIMDYLTKTNQVTDKIKDKATRFMKLGYQRALTYKHKTGPYSLFGNKDAQGSVMLTAFVVRSFARARSFIFVDDEEIERCLKWFEKIQQQSGCFANYGKVFSRNLQGGLNSKKIITAYVTASLLESGKIVQSSMVSKALSCLASQVNSSDDTYTIALTSYTLALAKHSKASKMIKLLKSRAIKKDDQLYWFALGNESTSTIQAAQFSSLYFSTSSTDVETTGYALLALLKQDTLETEDAGNIIRWLTKQRNSYGGFSSTQDTCIALQALAAYAEMAFGESIGTGSKKLLGSIKIKDYIHNFTVTDKTRLFVQHVKLPPRLLPDKLTLTAKGSGCALVQTTVRYNIPKPEENPVFKLNITVRRRRLAAGEEQTFCNPLQLLISVRWLKKDASNMVVVNLKLVSGFSVIEESLKLLENNHTINLKRYDVERQNVMLYFDEIKNITFGIDIHQNAVVKKLKPATIRVYDYTDPENEAKVMYNIDEKECYGDKIQKLCPKCLSVENVEALVNESVNCTTYISLVKSTHGVIKIARGYRWTKYQEETFLPYEIPEFCLCEEIYDKLKSLVVAPTNYFRGTSGIDTVMTLDSGTTILKWPKDIAIARKVKQRIRETVKKCRGQ